MLLAKPARSNPRAIAQALVAALPASDAIAAVEIAGPGFLNFRLAAGGVAGPSCARSMRRARAYGRNDRRRRPAAPGSNTSPPTRPARCMSATAAPR